MKSTILATVFALACAFPAAPQAPLCTCDNSKNSVCTFHGYEMTLTSFTVDQTQGTTNYEYRVCNQANGFKGCFRGSCSGGDNNGQPCNFDGQCPGGACQGSGTVIETGCTSDSDCGGGICAACVPRQALGEFYVKLPDCLSQNQQVSIQQIGGTSAAALTCSIATQSQSNPCSGQARVAKCTVNTGSSLDSGECVTVRLTIGGEVPTLGVGGARASSTQVSFCDESCILGPSCSACEPPPQEGGGCLTRTPGFWGTHPAITSIYLPITVCGQPLNTTVPNSCSSVTEALCVAPGKESPGNSAYAQLVRQLAAAKLNLAASGEGNCGSDIVTLINNCEALCGSSQQIISASGCIEALDAFNESQDTVSATPPPFDKPGPATPTYCQTANGNGVLIGSSCTTVATPNKK